MGFFNFFKEKPVMPESIEAAMASQASNFINTFRSEGAPVKTADLDYTEASLHFVDQFLNDFHSQQASLPDDLHFLASAYVFECARKQFGGRYLRGDEENPFVLVIGEPECQIGFCLMPKIKGRVINGIEDNIPFFYQGIQPLLDRKASATLV